MQENVRKKALRLKIPGQHDSTATAGKAMDGDRIGVSVGDVALDETAEVAAPIIVAAPFAQLSDVGTFVNGEQRIKGAADGVESDGAIDRRGPLEPNRGSSRLTRRVRLARRQCRPAIVGLHG